jgi:hypothetical protein
LSSILFNFYSEYLTKKAVGMSAEFKEEGEVIRTVKYADELVLLAKEGTVLEALLID